MKAPNHLMKNNVGHYIPKEDWPPNLLDLSPIENLWSIITAAVYACPRAANTDGTWTSSSEIL